MKTENIKKNYFFNLLYEVIVVLYPIIVTPYLSRILLPEGIGIKSYTYAMMTYFYYLGMLGIDIYGQREISFARKDEKLRSKIFYEIYILKFLTMGISIGIYVLCVFLTPFGGNYKIYFLCWVIFLFDAMISVKWYMAGINYFKQLSLVSIIVKVISIFAIFIFIKTKEDLYKYIIILGCVPLLSDLLIMFFVKKTTVKVSFSELHVFRHLKGTIVFFIPTIASAIYSTIDKAMLTSLVGEEETGFYEQANKLITLSYTIVSALFTVLRSTCCYLVERDDQESQQKYKDVIKEYLFLTLMLSLPLTFGILSISKDFVPLFFGEDFIDSTAVLQILSPLILLISISQFLNSTVIIPKKKTLKIDAFYFVAAAINMLFNFLLIKSLGARGAAIASVISELFLMGVFLVFSRNEVGIKLFCLCGYRYLFAAVIMGLGIFIFSYFVDWTLWVKVVIEIVEGISIYFSILLLFKDKYLFKLIKETFGKFF